MTTERIPNVSYLKLFKREGLMKEWTPYKLSDIGLVTLTFNNLLLLFLLYRPFPRPIPIMTFLVKEKLFLFKASFFDSGS